MSLRGVDNASYYRLTAGDGRYYVDFTGCGNTLNMQHPQVLRMIMDSLRYWILEMHVDGFRFDLASALARELHEVDKLGAFFDIIHQDPVISRVKLIAEPWDIGEGGYQVGQFPVLWTEWNGKYRDAVRAFWKDRSSSMGELATRLAGSSDLYEESGRKPHASINFVTSHDGFTLADLVSYDGKHNEANGEGNRDGDSHNLSWNCGVEGPTDDPAVLALRRRQRRNLASTLAFSLGVPMISGGDELGRTQGGNNNAYCQDNETSWYDWALDAEGRRFLAFVRRVLAIRRENPVFRRRSFLTGRGESARDAPDIYWLKPDDAEMRDADWHDPDRGALGVLLRAEAIDEIDPRGVRVVGDTMLLLINARDADVPFVLSAREGVRRWERLLDTTFDDPVAERRRVWKRGETYAMTARSVALFRGLRGPASARRGEPA
jgi:glycogen operon protein